MMANEYILLIYCSVISFSIIGALWLKEAGLSALMSLFLVLINLFVTKHITLFGLTATAADPLAIGIPLTLNLLQEHYGAKASNRAIWISFYVACVYVIVSMIHLWYTPSVVDISHYHFHALLMPMPRIVTASFMTFLIAQYTDRYVYRAIRSVIPRRYALVASYVSTSMSQAVDTVSFALLGLYGIMYNLYDIIIVSYAIKIITLLGTAPFTVAAQYIYRYINTYTRK